MRAGLMKFSAVRSLGHVSMTDIEGEVLRNETTEEAEKINTPLENPPAVASENSDQVANFNPLDAQPASFATQLQTRQENYDNLQLHLQGVLVAGKDFGRIHVKKDCPDKYNCKNDYHFSGYMLFAPGADKILGILGLGVHYPDLKDYKRAVLQGHTLEEVIADCQILGYAGGIISEGAGACARKEVQGSLNNCIKRACKRARLDAVLRLPVVSALFEGDFLAKMAAAQKVQGQRTAAQRAQQLKTNQYNTGARLEVCPIGNEIKGKPWIDIPTPALEYLVANCQDKPDIHRAAAEELSKRISATDSSSIRTSSSSGFDDQPPEHDDDEIQ